MIQQVTIQMTSARTYVLEGNKKCDQLNPKELMLLAGVTCAGMTAMAIMEKERVSPTRFELSISGELDTETVQSSSVFKSFRIVYNVQCECENDQMKVSRAINLAHDKHCGGVQMLRKIAPVTDEIAIVNTKEAEALQITKKRRKGCVEMKVPGTALKVVRMDAMQGIEGKGDRNLLP